MFSAFSKGLFAHVRGMRFALAHKGYLALIAIPFFVTVVLYVLGFMLFTANADHMLALVWTPDAVTPGGLTSMLFWVYVHVVKYLLYLLVFILMYFLFMVVANIVASPLYDAIAGRMLRDAAGGAGPGADGASLWLVVIEEIKKAVLVGVLPLLLVFIPILGQFLAPVVAAILLAFDFFDFSFCREEPRFAVRLRAMAKRPFLLLGFGAPLLVPILNIVIFPFAILGATLLYLETTGRSLGQYSEK